MKIKNGRVEGVEFRAAHSFGGDMTPTGICLHDTAGRLDKFSSVEWFCSDECNTSAHIVIERDGTIVQQVPFNRKAWHAGASTFKGRQNCNGFLIGIEIVNPGKLDKDGRAWFHKKTERGYDVKGLKHVKTAEHGDGWWMPYTQEQIEAVTKLCKALAGAYPTIEDVTTHWFISPGRKIDTNPLFPVEQVRRSALSVRSADEAAELEPMVPTEAPAPVTGKEIKAEGSGSFSSIDRALAALGLPTLATIIGWLMDMLGFFKGTFDALKTFLVDHKEQVLLMGLMVAAGVIAILLYGRFRLLVAARQGRYLTEKRAGKAA